MYMDDDFLALIFLIAVAVFMTAGILMGRIIEKGLEERGGEWDWCPSSLDRLLRNGKKRKV